MQLFFLFLFFFRLHTLGRTLAKEPKKKKARRFFPDAIWPLGHKCPVGQCEMAAAKKKRELYCQGATVTLRMPAAKKKKRELYCQGARHYKIDFHYDFRAEASYRLKKRASDDKASYRLKKRILPAQASSNIKPLLALSGPYPLDTTLCKNFSRGHLAHWLIWPLGTQCNMKPILALSGPYLWSTPLCKIFSKGHLAH